MDELVADFPCLQLIRSVEEVKDLPALPSVAVGTIPSAKPIDSAIRETFVAIFHHDRSVKAAKVLLEMAYRSFSTTALMNMASDAGWKSVEGVEALIWQGIEQFKIWTGISVVYRDAQAAVLGRKGE